MSRPKAKAADLVLAGCDLRYGGFRHRSCTALAVRGQRIWASGTDEAMMRLAGADTAIVHLRGGSLLPGFVDAHLHFKALVRRKTSLDCGTVADGEALLQILAARCGQADADWIFAHGLEHRKAGFGVLPSMEALDRATAGRPLWLRHRSGHMSVFNTEALRRLGCRHDPPGAGSLETVGDHPTGVGFGMESWVGKRLRADQPPPAANAIEETSRELLREGVTAFADLTASNRLGDLAWWETQQAAGRITQRVRIWLGHDALVEDPKLGRHATSASLGIAGVKVMLRSDTLRPSAEELALALRRAARQGLATAIHTVESDSLALVLDALALDALVRAGIPPDGPRPMVRLEHLNSVAPTLLDSLAGHGVGVCVQPAMMWEQGSLYRHTVPAAERGWLFAVGSIVRAAKATAIGSDAPAAPSNLLRHVAAAVSRKDRDGRSWNLRERIGAETALRAITNQAAGLAGFGDDTGVLAAGGFADGVAFEQPWPELRKMLEQGDTPVPVGTLAGGRWRSWCDSAIRRYRSGEIV